MVTKKNYKKCTNEEIRGIIDDFYDKKTPLTKADLSRKYGKVSSLIHYIIDGFENGNKRIIAKYNNGIEAVKAGGKAMHVGTDEKKAVVTGEHVTIVKPKNGKTVPVKKPAKVSPGKHAQIPHELNAKYKNLDRKELEFLKGAKNSNDFIVAYFQNFGYDVKTVSMLNEVWKRREDILKYEDDKKKHAIVGLKKRVITETLKVDSRKSSAMVHEEDTLSNLSNKVSVMNQLYKEVIELQKEVLTSLDAMKITA